MLRYARMPGARTTVCALLVHECEIEKQPKAHPSYIPIYSQQSFFVLYPAPAHTHVLLFFFTLFVFQFFAHSSFSSIFFTVFLRFFYFFFFFTLSSDIVKRNSTRYFTSRAVAAGE